MQKGLGLHVYGNMWHKKFTDFWDNVESFMTEFKACPLYGSATYSPAYLSDNSIIWTYYLLYARYGNSTIVNDDETQFKFKLWSIMFQYGPTWERKLNLQKTLRSLTEDEILLGTRQVNQHAYNPSTDVNTNITGDYGEIDTTNEQTRSWYKKAKLEGYANLMSLLENDVTDEYLVRFKPLFMRLVQPQTALLYEGED